jgi:tetratricopeptide (TPR) repeat protein
MRTPPQWISWLLLAFFCAAGVQAQAPDAGDERARTLFAAAQAHFDTGDYEQAVGEFSEAYQLSGRAALLYNIYLCHERLGNLDAAVEQLSRYLAADPNASNVDALRTRLENMRRRASALAREQQERAARATSLQESPLAELPEQAPHEPRRYAKPAVITALSIGGVGMASFGVFAILSEVKNSQLDKTCVDACSDSQVKGLRTYSLTADLSLAAGATGLLVGGILWWIGNKRAAAPALSLAPVLGPRNLGLAAGGHF